MSYGKMNTFIEIEKSIIRKDDEGFSTVEYVTVASIRAYKEERHGNERWANRAAFSSATALFRFRSIPNLKIDTTLSILCDDERYQIFSVENIRNRNMYIEILADKIDASKG